MEKEIVYHRSSSGSSCASDQLASIRDRLFFLTGILTESRHISGTGIRGLYWIIQDIATELDEVIEESRQEAGRKEAAA